MKKTYIIFLFLFSFFLESNSQEEKIDLYKEKYRPQFHFSPKEGWIGDPCGFIYYQGKYQMFWWGKVVSDDLVHYKEVSQKVMTGDNGKTAYFTGSVLVDKNNTAGFGANTMIASYTIFDHNSKNQSQGISYSHDGDVFHYYKDNPVLDIGSTEFRDPTVIWHEPTKKWIMLVALALEKKIRFYSSPDLKKWIWMSDFGPAGDSERSWECPDFFQLSVDGNPENKKWVMVVSINWAREQYFIGDFDGTTFKLINEHPQQPLYVDYGLDYYASRTFQDYDNTLENIITMGWVAYWDYAPKAPSKWGKGFWSIPRTLALKTYSEGIRMVQSPVENLSKLRDKQATYKGIIPQGITVLPKFSPKENVYEMEAFISTDISNVVGFNLCVGDGRKVVFSYDTQSQTLLVDRTNCSDTHIDKFSRISFAKVTPINSQIKLHFLVDKSSIELFTNEGKDVFTLLTYPGETQTGIEIFALNKGTSINYTAWTLKTIWNKINK